MSLKKERDRFPRRILWSSLFSSFKACWDFFKCAGRMIGRTGTACTTSSPFLSLSCSSLMISVTFFSCLISVRTIFVISVALTAAFSFSEFGYSKKSRVSTHDGVIVTQVKFFCTFCCDLALLTSLRTERRFWKTFVLVVVADFNRVVWADVLVFASLIDCLALFSFSLLTGLFWLEAVRIPRRGGICFGVMQFTVTRKKKLNAKESHCKSKPAEQNKWVGWWWMV